MSLQNEVLVNASRTLSDAGLSAIELFEGYPDGLLKFATIASLIIMIVGIPGNIKNLVKMGPWDIRIKHNLCSFHSLSRNATAIFIINLSCSDLIFCFNIPLAASVYHHHAWVHGQILCQISIFTKYTLFINSLFSVFAITINRYIMIAHPKSYTKIYKKRNIIIMLVCTWLLSILLVIPIVFKVNDRFEVNESCSSQSHDYIETSLKKVIFLIAFILPCIAMIFCYARIFCIVLKVTSNKKSLNKGKRVLNAKESSSLDVVTSETSSNSISEQFKTTKTLSRYKNIIMRSTEMEKLDNILKRPEKIEMESPRIRQTKLQKSFKFLKMALPCRKDRRLGTMIIAIMISFCVCHIPIMLIKLFLTENLLPKLTLVSHILFFSSFGINPIIYVVISREYRKVYKNLFKRLNNFCCVRKTKVPI